MVSSRNVAASKPHAATKATYEDASLFSFVPPLAAGCFYVMYLQQGVTSGREALRGEESRNPGHVCAASVPYDDFSGAVRPGNGGCVLVRSARRGHRYLQVIANRDAL